ncbi:hypothetical protein ACOME3_008794 [Neoechinorhynchus agilis]
MASTHLTPSSVCYRGGIGTPEELLSSSALSSPTGGGSTSLYSGNVNAQALERILLSNTSLVSPKTRLGLYVNFDHDPKYHIPRSQRAVQVLRPLMNCIIAEATAVVFEFHEFSSRPLNLSTQEEIQRFVDDFNKLANLYLDRLNNSKDSSWFFDDTFCSKSLDVPNGWNGSADDKKVRLIPDQTLKHVLEYAYASAVTNPRKLVCRAGETGKTYGETSFECVKYAIDFVSQQRKFDRVVDLGSGVGNVILQFAASRTLTSCVGVEVSDWPLKFCQGIAANFERCMHWLGYQYSPFVLRSGNFLDQKFEHIIRAADVIFINNVSFDSDVNEALRKLFHSLRDGVRIVTAVPIPSRSEKPEFKLDFRTSIRITKVLPPFPVSWCSTPLCYIVHEIEREYVVPRPMGFSSPAMLKILHPNTQTLCNRRFVWIDRAIDKVRKGQITTSLHRSKSCGNRRLPYRNVVKLLNDNRKFITRGNDVIINFHFSLSIGMKVYSVPVSRLSRLASFEHSCEDTENLSAFNDNDLCFSELGILIASEQHKQISLPVRATRRCDLCWTRGDIQRPPFRRHSIESYRVPFKHRLKQIDIASSLEIKLQSINIKFDKLEILKDKRRRRVTKDNTNDQSIRWDNDDLTAKHNETRKRSPVLRDRTDEIIDVVIKSSLPNKAHRTPLSSEHKCAPLEEAIAELVEKCPGAIDALLRPTPATESPNDNLPSEDLFRCSYLSNDFVQQINRKRRQSKDVDSSSDEDTPNLKHQPTTFSDSCLDDDFSSSGSSIFEKPDSLLQLVNEAVTEAQVESQADMKTLRRLSEGMKTTASKIRRREVLIKINQQSYGDLMETLARCIDIIGSLAEDRTRL